MNDGGLVLVVGPAPDVAAAVGAAGYEVASIDDLADIEAGSAAVAVVLTGPLHHVGLNELGPAVIVICTDDDVDIRTAMQRGAHDVIRTPIVPAELAMRLRAAARATGLAADVRDLARIDPLTGLANRPFLDDHLAKACSLARRLRTPLSVLMVDVDRMRRINDEHGRAAGDLVVAEVARRVRRGLRGEDVAGRWGGEEFVVLLPHTPLDGAWRLADRIRASVCDEPIPIDASSAADVVVTVSIGCAEGYGDDLDEQLRRAQSALDEAKSAGRNKVVAR